MSTTSNYRIEKSYLTQNWNDLYMTSQVIAEAVKELTTDLNHSRNGPDRQLYIHHIDDLSKWGYGFKTPSDGIYYTAGGNYYKCETLLSLIQNLACNIIICPDKDLMMGDQPMPAAKVKAGLSNSNRSHSILLISNKAMEVLNAYKDQEEARKNRIEKERTVKKQSEEDERCCMQ